VFPGIGCSAFERPRIGSFRHRMGSGSPAGRL